MGSIASSDNRQPCGSIAAPLELFDVLDEDDLIYVTRTPFPTGTYPISDTFPVNDK